MFSTWHGLLRFQKFNEKKTAPDKIWGDKAFNITINPKYDGYQMGLTSMVYKF